MRAVRGHASPRRLYAARMRLAIARGSRSHTARNRTPLAIARGSSSQALASSRGLAGCGRTRPRRPEYMMDMATSAEMLMRKRTRSASRSAVHGQAPHETCADGVRTRKSDPEAKHAARALGIQRWQWQTGQARQDGSRKPAQTQTPARSGAGLLTHAASYRKRGAGLVPAWAPSQQVSACAVQEQQKVCQRPALVAEGPSKRSTRRRGRQVGWLHARAAAAACLRRTSGECDGHVRLDHACSQKRP